MNIIYIVNIIPTPQFSEAISVTSLPNDVITTPPGVEMVKLAAGPGVFLGLSSAGEVYVWEYLTSAAEDFGLSAVTQVVHWYQTHTNLATFSQFHQRNHSSVYKYFCIILKSE